jgi:hypothetical protein
MAETPYITFQNAAGKGYRFPLERCQTWDFLRFASWAFSAEGIPDLQVLAWGDFSYEGRYARHNLLLCKAQNGYRTLTKADIKCWDLVHDNMKMLSACAVDSIMI